MQRRCAWPYSSPSPERHTLRLTSQALAPTHIEYVGQVLGGGPVPRLALGAGGAPLRTPRETQRSAANTDPFFSARSGGQTARSAFAASAYSFRSMGVRLPACHP